MNDLFRSLVFARVMTVEPLSRALCPDPLESPGKTVVAAESRWRTAAIRAARNTPSDLQPQEYSNESKVDW